MGGSLSYLSPCVSRSLRPARVSGLGASSRTRPPTCSRQISRACRLGEAKTGREVLMNVVVLFGCEVAVPLSMKTPRADFLPSKGWHSSLHRILARISSKPGQVKATEKSCECNSGFKSSILPPLKGSQAGEGQQEHNVCSTVLDRLDRDHVQGRRLAVEDIRVKI